MNIVAMLIVTVIRFTGENEFEVVVTSFTFYFDLLLVRFRAF